MNIRIQLIQSHWLAFCAEHLHFQQWIYSITYYEMYLANYVHWSFSVNFVNLKQSSTVNRRSVITAWRKENLVYINLLSSADIENRSMPGLYSFIFNAFPPARGKRQLTEFYLHIWTASHILHTWRLCLYNRVMYHIFFLSWIAAFIFLGYIV